jgi:hypothetical protein
MADDHDELAEISEPLEIDGWCLLWAVVIAAVLGAVAWIFFKMLS